MARSSLTLRFFLRHQRLFHGGQLDVEIEFGQIEIGREGFRRRCRPCPTVAGNCAAHTPIGCDKNRAGWRTFPRWDGRRQRASDWRGRRARCRGAPVADASETEAAPPPRADKRPLLGEPARVRGGAQHLGHLRRVHVLRVQHDVEGFGEAVARPEPCATRTPRESSSSLASASRASGRSSR